MNKDERYWNAVKILKKVLDELREAEEENLEAKEEERREVFSYYGGIFQNIDTLSKEDFQEFLSFKKNKHWTNLERHKNHLTEDMADLKRVLKICLDETKPIGTRIDDSFEKKYFGKGIATAFLLVASEGKYGVWNKTSKTALEYLGIWPKLPRGASVGDEYKRLNVLLVKLSKDISTDLWILDWLFWVLLNKTIADEFPITEQISEKEQKKYPGGGVKKVVVNQYERNNVARKKCIESRGSTCSICAFDFGKTYGDKYKGFIHVHHIKPVSEISDKYEVDPIEDLRPVCPNCHAVIHFGGKTLSVEEVKRIRKK